MALHDNHVLMQLIYKTSPSIIQATPSRWRSLFASDWQYKKDLKILVGGEALDRPLAQALLNKAAWVWNMYGPTETTIWSSMNRILSANTISIGYPIANTQLYVLDSHLQFVPIGAIGELYIGGVGLSRGYWNRHDVTAERFILHSFSKEAAPVRLYKTGDLVRWNEERQLEYVGRNDFQVKIRGHRIECGEIEYILKEYTGIKDALVVATDGQPNKQQLVAYVVGEKNAISIDSLKQMLRNRFPEYMLPTAIMLLDKIPLNINGKVDRKALPTPDFNVSEASYLAPKTSLEKSLIGAWENTLEYAPIGMLGDFFELGGNSLLAVLLVYKIKQKWNVDLQSVDIFKHRRADEFLIFLSASLIKKFIIRKINRHIKTNIPRLFLIHDILGTSRHYHGLSEHMTNSMSIYGIDSFSLTRDIRFENMDLMAKAYCHKIKKVQPNGPYYLGGWSFGGFVAFEIARHLNDIEEKVAFVILLDSYIRAEFSSVDQAENFSQLIRAKNITPSTPMYASLWKEYTNNMKLFEKYKPTSYKIDRLIFITANASAEDNDNKKRYWESRSRFFKMYSVSSFHEEMFDSSNIVETASVVNQAISDSFT